MGYYNEADLIKTIPGEGGFPIYKTKNMKTMILKEEEEFVISISLIFSFIREMFVSKMMTPIVNHLQLVEEVFSCN